MIRVLFVCLGNICRSPMAEAVFANQVREAGLEEEIQADSAGTGRWHVGSPPHRGTREALAARDIEYSGRARVLTASDLRRFDYIIAMDAFNLEDIRALGETTARLHRFLEFDAKSTILDVPDPYYDGRFELVYDLVERASRGLLDHIRRAHDL